VRCHASLRMGTGQIAPKIPCHLPIAEDHTFMSSALIMLSMNVVTAKAAKPSGAEFPRIRLPDLLVLLLAAHLIV
jgi:hypothetical protein